MKTRDSSLMFRPPKAKYSILIRVQARKIWLDYNTHSQHLVRHPTNKWPTFTIINIHPHSNSHLFNSSPSKHQQIKTIIHLQKIYNQHIMNQHHSQYWWEYRRQRRKLIIMTPSFLLRIKQLMRMLDRLVRLLKRSTLMIHSNTRTWWNTIKQHD